jgi:hypothetical protein
VCYNCVKNGHFIAQCPYKRKEEDNDKKKRLDKVYKKDKKFTKKKHYGQAHVGQEWNLSDESSELESDNVAAIIIRAKLHQASHTLQTSPSTHASWQRKSK